MGGKSSSSNATSSTSNIKTTSGSATGTVGDVLQGENITINENLPDNAVDVFEQLVSLAKSGLDLAGDAGKKTIETIESVSQSAKQPDLTLLQGYQKQVIYLIGGAVAIIGLVMLMRK